VGQKTAPFFHCNNSVYSQQIFTVTPLPCKILITKEIRWQTLTTCDFIHAHLFRKVTILLHLQISIFDKCNMCVAVKGDYVET